MDMSMLNTVIAPFDTTKDLVELSSEWPKWKRAFDFFVETKDIKDSNQKCAFLMHAGGMGLQEIFANLPEKTNYDKDKESEDEDDDDGEDDVYNNAISKLDNYFCMKRNTTVERYIFRSIRQLSEESFDQFIIRLRTQLNRCEFGLLADEHMRDQIIEGTSSDKLREKALLKNAITLAELSELGQTLEATKINLKNLRNGKEPNSDTLNYVSNNKSVNGRDLYSKRKHINGDVRQNKRARYDTSNNKMTRK